MAETAFDYVADRGLVHVRVVPESGRLTAVIAPGDRSASTEVAAGTRAAAATPPEAGCRKPQTRAAAGANARAVSPCVAAACSAAGVQRATGVQCAAARRIAGRLRQPAVQGRRAGPGRAAQASRRFGVVRPAPAGGGAAAIPHPRRNAAPIHAGDHGRPAPDDAARDHAGSEPGGVERDGRLGLRLRDRGAGALPRERRPGPQGSARRVPRDPGEDIVRRRAGDHQRGAGAVLSHQGAGAGHGAHGLREVHHAVRHDRPHQPDAHRPHHHDRRSDRVRA